MQSGNICIYLFGSGWIIAYRGNLASRSPGEWPGTISARLGQDPAFAPAVQAIYMIILPAGLRAGESFWNFLALYLRHSSSQTSEAGPADGRRREL